MKSTTNKLLGSLSVVILGGITGDAYKRIQDFTIQEHHFWVRVRLTDAYREYEDNKEDN